MIYGNKSNPFNDMIGHSLGGLPASRIAAMEPAGLRGGLITVEGTAGEGCTKLKTNRRVGFFKHVLFVPYLVVCILPPNLACFVKHLRILS